MSEALLTPAVTMPRNGSAPKGMVLVPGGVVRMGSADFYPEEQPVVAVKVDSFWMDEHPVTVAEFRRFVKATGYVTLAERELDPADYPDALLADLVPGALVFQMTSGPVDLREWRQWWSYAPGAWWRHPFGPDSTLDGKELHPVTQIAYQDAVAYAAWAGKSLPTEAEWEAAARGGLDGAVFAWGDEFMPKGRPMANTWHGDFPWQHRTPGLGGKPGTTPVRTYPPNGYGLYDMTGNVWEWTSDYFSTRPAEPASCCAPRNPQAAELIDGERFARRVTKGGSHLCAPNYCLRYRPAARQGQAEDTATCHLGFRCVLRD
jgi:formylglycine-generating enzyme